ncbi:MAG: FadR/GntR family transcriptional regulator [Acetivibrionales bacterium]|jgi:DNA-binding FadR family transcriptional regulator
MNQERAPMELKDVIKPNSSKIKFKNKCDMVMEKVLDFIVEGHYKYGDRLPPENEFAEKFGVSRVTIRESFKKLSIIGVVDIRQGEGTFVKKVTPSSLIELVLPLMMLDMNEFEELYEGRICIETAMARLAARKRTQEDVDRLSALIPLMEECLINEDILRYNELDAQFHTMIAEMSKNKILMNMHSMLKKVRDRCIRISNSNIESIEYSINSHKQILEAIVWKDEVNIASLMNLHLNHSKRQNEQYLKNQLEKNEEEMSG